MGRLTMTIEELAKKLELMDDKKVICCYIEYDNIVASFTTREGITVNVLTPYEKRLLEHGKFTDEDIIRKYFELKQIANFKPE